MDLWFEEFTFRGRPPSGVGSDLPSEFHLIIGRQVTSALDPSRHERELVGPLTPDQAAGMGLPLETVLEAINEVAVQDVIDLTAQVAALEAELTATRRALEQLRGAMEQAREGDIS